MGVDSWMWDVDQRLSHVVGQWNGYTTTIFTLLLGIWTWALFNRKEPDTHPMLLARQAQSSPVRQPGESPVYRCHAAPHGMPLNSGLNVKDPGASKWAKGRDGDLRDIWRRAVAGVPEGESNTGGKGKLLTVHGDKVDEQNLDGVTRQINIIGQHILDQGGNRVAIYLPNSVELLAALFACAFHNLTAIILPIDQPEDVVISMLRRSAADTVIALPGAFPFDLVVKNYPSLRNVIWVVDEGNRHLDWNEVPKGMGGSVNVATWHDLIAEAPQDAGKELPPAEGQKDPRDVTVFWQNKAGELEEMVRFTTANLVAAVSAQIFAVPTSQRLGPSDLFLPAAPLSDVYTLTLTLAALFSNSSVALNSVAAQSRDLQVATRGISPTVIVATPEALLQTRAQSANSLKSFIASTVHGIQTRSLQNGIMPAASLLTSFNDSLRPAIGRTPGKLRLVFVAERVGAGTPPLSSAALSDLRILTGARIVYALTAPKVAGAIAQTNFYDYRISENEGEKGCSHFGPPMTSTEIMLKDKGVHKTTDDKIEGEIIVRGPSVAGNEAALGVVGRILDDNTLAYV
ncbi:hypothetical protein MCOR25_006937 [Pyricularia grisea]|uniref:AMP-dependent synthetase/ligase domain-containing protein n=1 Tax=Pyricularia grisea TaxID=148305 RepID=A0A6P8B349_PYRGI|nr:uncharacterized protein PgNI_07894 [Pyricularia grisea]KAI6359764.1 hypothetical protein MCOR25_006937 [Pyricularia grisea]TLD09128.1 hypothetical protein PgNI_07894 [Pyricularia grisea]